MWPEAELLEVEEEEVEEWVLGWKLVLPGKKQELIRQMIISGGFCDVVPLDVILVLVILVLVQ